jgi:hypothetical protein
MVANKATAVAQGAGGQDTVQWLTDQLADVKRQLAELRRLPPSSLNVKVPGSTNVDMQAYADTILHWADGSPFVWIRINEKGGRCFQTFPVSYVDPGPNTIVATAAWALFNPTQSPSYDLISSDALSGWGLSKPWISVPLYPNFVPVVPGTATNGAFLGYWNISTAASGMAQGVTLWYGEIPLVSHPKFNVDFFGGQASGTVVPTYTLWIAGVQVDSWTSTGGFGWNNRQVDLTTWQQFTVVTVEIRVNWTGAGQLAAKIGSCYLRGS